MKIALIEEPKSCASCPFLDMGYALDMCRLSKKQVTTAESINIPKWCELRDLPFLHREREEEIEGADYAEGFNKCLEEITGTRDWMYKVYFDGDEE